MPPPSSTFSASGSTFIIGITVFFLSLGHGSHADEVYNRILTEPEETSLDEIKRSWQNLQGSWGKRADREDTAGNNGYLSNNYDDPEYQMNLLLSMDPPSSVSGATSSGVTIDYLNAEPVSYPKLANFLGNSNSLSALSLSTLSQNPELSSKNGQKRAWKSMSGAWGKRLGSGDWNKFRGSWGKREPGWNNLKGLWGKRAANANNWNKLQSAWGKRDQI